MVRPRKRRKVSAPPRFGLFKPAGVPNKKLETATLSVAEYEALRLSDLNGELQSDVADKMGISQPTLHRLLSEARHKLADAIVNGKAIRIEGGEFELVGMRLFRCSDCNAEWSEPFGTGRPKNCKECSSKKFVRT